MRRYERRWREERWYGNGVKYSIHISNSQKLKVRLIFYRNSRSK